VDEGLIRANIQLVKFSLLEKQHHIVVLRLDGPKLQACQKEKPL
jgi:hypothetical protein